MKILGWMFLIGYPLMLFFAVFMIIKYDKYKRKNK